MKTKQFLIEIKNSFPLFFALIAINLIISVLSLWDELRFIDEFIRPMYGMVAWTIILVYIITNLYKELYFGKNKLILMVPRKTSFLWYEKYAAFSFQLMFFLLVNFIYEFISKNGIYEIAIKNSQSPFLNSLYYIGSNILSVLCGIALLFLSMGIGKASKNKTVSYLITGVIFAGLTIAYVVCILNYTGALAGETAWSIGINTGVHVFNQFAGIIPVMIIPKKESYDISETVSIANMAANTIILIVSLTAVYITANYIKFDFKEG